MTECLGELQHEVAQRADGDLLADVAALRVVEFLVAGVDFLLRGGNQGIEQVVGLNAEALAAGDLNVRLGAIFFA